MRQLPAVFLERLMVIGSSGDFSGLHELFREFPPESVGHYMREPPAFWLAIADALSDADLEALIRSLTIAERDFSGFGGGSVSGVIWSFRRLKERKGGQLDALAEWVLAHTTNGW